MIDIKNRYSGLECGRGINVKNMMVEWEKITSGMHGKKPLDVVRAFFEYFQARNIRLQHDQWAPVELRKKVIEDVSMLPPSLLDAIRSLVINDPVEILLFFLDNLGRENLWLWAVDRQLTGDQYFEMLLKVKEMASQEVFHPEYHDSTDIGAKYTTSNVGLCNDNDLVTFENSSFPSDYLTRGRNDMKDLADHQSCPFDYRKKRGINGCFWTCCFFQKHLSDIDKIRDLVQERIDEWKKHS